MLPAISEVHVLTQNSHQPTVVIDQTQNLGLVACYTSVRTAHDFGNPRYLRYVINLMERPKEFMLRLQLHGIQIWEDTAHLRCQRGSFFRSSEVVHH